MAAGKDRGTKECSYLFVMGGLSMFISLGASTEGGREETRRHGTRSGDGRVA